VRNVVASGHSRDSEHLPCVRRRCQPYGFRISDVTDSVRSRQARSTYATCTCPPDTEGAHHSSPTGAVRSICDSSVAVWALEPPGPCPATSEGDGEGHHLASRLPMPREGALLDDPAHALVELTATDLRGLVGEPADPTAGLDGPAHRHPAAAQRGIGGLGLLHAAVELVALGDHR